MSVLEELKKEAASVKAQEEKARSAAQKEHEERLKSIRPRMQAIYRYFKDMAENLNVVDPDVRVSYDVPGFGALKALRQTGYRLSSPDNRALNQITFHFNCVAEGKVKFLTKGKEAAERQRQNMWEHNLRFTSKLLADGSGSFTLDAFVPVTLEFTSVLDRGVVQLRARNLSGLGASNISYDPEQLTDEFLDELGKAVMRQPNRFDELSGNTLTDEARRRLRQQLAHDGYKRLAEEEAAAKAQAEAAAAAAADAPPAKRGLLRGLLKRK